MLCVTLIIKSMHCFLCSLQIIVASDLIWRVTAYIFCGLGDGMGRQKSWLSISEQIIKSIIIVGVG